MWLLLDIGNTNTHLGMSNRTRVLRHADAPTSSWFDGSAPDILRRFIGDRDVDGCAYCSVVPKATQVAAPVLKKLCGFAPFRLTASTVVEIGIDYPSPETIGPDRLANAIAARALYGAPSVVVDFGTAVTFDILDKRGNYVGGIIAPGLAAMTDYLHEKTALLPRIRIADVDTAIGKSTRQAMLIGAVHGYRGLIHGLLREIKAEMKVRDLPVVATGGYAKLIAAKLPDITDVDSLLTLEGLRTALEARRPSCQNSLEMSPL